MKTPESTPVLDATEEHFAAVMALTLDPTKTGRAVVRCITKRIGDPTIPGFVDKSELRIAEWYEGVWHIAERLEITGLNDIIGKVQPVSSVFLGPEDPDLCVTDDGVLHLFFTIPFLVADKTNVISLGHASGPDLYHLGTHKPVLASKPHGPGFKEVCVGPVNSKGKRYILTESSDMRERWYSTMAVAIAPANLGGQWADQGLALHPLAIREKYAKYATKKGSYEWCSEHVSPSKIIPSHALTHNDFLVGLMNGRSRQVEGVYGKFLPGLFLFDPETGEIPWVDPQPLFDDPAARTVVFASDIEMLPDGQMKLYAHIDDERIVAYEISLDAIKKRLPQDSL